MMDLWREYMSEEDACGGVIRSHLASVGYEGSDTEDRPGEVLWTKTFINKVVVARKDHPKFGIKKGEKHRFIKTKVICDEDGSSEWVVSRKPLKVAKPQPVTPAVAPTNVVLRQTAKSPYSWVGWREFN
jgi:hypothetical protein